MSARILSKTLKPFANTSMSKMFTFKRFKSRGKCASQEHPICSKEAQKICPSKMGQLEAKKDFPKIQSMWENPECCKDPCPEFFARFDDLYYKSSNKLEKTYSPTWVSCPELQLKPKKVCSYEDIKFIPVEKRARKKRPQTACQVGGSKNCMNTKSQKCSKMLMPGCRGSRQPPKCKRERSISDCLKECTPYPSYSECLRKQEEPLHPLECKCLDHRMMCDVWAEMRHRMTFVKG